MPIRILLVIIFVALAMTSTARAQSRVDLYSGLERGPYSVSFEERLLADRSRRSIGDADVSSPRPPPAEAIGRQMHYFIWRPALANGAPLRFADYVAADVRRRHLGPASPDEVRSEIEGYVAVDRTARPEFAASIDAALDAPVLARAGAAPIEGRFPVIFIPDYFGADGPAVLAELLASRGYVVVAWESLGLFDDVHEVNARGLATSVEDMAFVMSRVLEEPYVDPERVGAVGMGYNASAIALQAMASPVIDAWVNLDHGLLTSFDDNVLKRSPLYDPTLFRAPVLVLYNPEPGLFPENLDGYPFAERIAARLPQMTEMHFTSFGALSGAAPDIMGPSPGETRRSYETAANLIGIFLDAKVRGDAQARTRLDAAVSAGTLSDGLVDRIERRPALAPLPLLPEWRTLLAPDDGAARFTEAWAAARTIHPAPMTAETFNALHDFLSNNGDDPDRSKRIALNEARVQAYPDSARAAFVLGTLYRAVGRADDARRMIDRALALLPEDQDPGIHASLRQRILAEAPPPSP